MSAPAGNKYALGNKGGGRKSAFQEQADAAFFADLWNGRLKKEKLQRKIQKGRYGAKHILAVKILEGNEKLLAKLMDKFFPDPQIDPISGAAYDRAEIDRQSESLRKLMEELSAQPLFVEDTQINTVPETLNQ